MKHVLHISLRIFEQLVLFPIVAFVFLLAVVALIEKAWLFGAFLLVMSLLLTMVGQAPPHRKMQTFRQLYPQDVGERFGNITQQESMELGKAVTVTAFLVGLIAGAVALHRELPWYCVLVYVILSWFLFPLGCLFFCFAWSWVMEKMRGKPHA